MGWPEWTLLALLAAGIGWALWNYAWRDAAINAASSAILLVLLYAGGFFN